MATEVSLPELGESVTEGTITQWLKSVGDDVAVDEPLVEVSTDKVDTEIPSPVAGTLVEIKANEDDTIEVGAVLAMVGSEEESASTSNGAGASGPSEQPTADSARADSGAGESTGTAQPAAAGRGSDQAAAAAQEAPAESTPAPAAQSDTGGSGGGASSGGGESTEVTLPELGESVTEGTITQWLKSVGDDVAVDEALLEVSTDKVDTEIPSPVAGTLLEVKVNEDETVEVGAVLALVGAQGAAPAAPAPAQKPAPTQEAPAEEATAEKAPAPEPAPQQAQQAPAQEAPTQPEPEPEAKPAPQQAAPAEPAAPAASQSQGSTGGDTKTYVTPLVRKLATQHGVDLSSLDGTGVGGRVRKQDVLAAAEAAKQPEPAAAAPTGGAPAAASAGAAPSPLRGTTEKLSRMRKVIAARMVESLQVSAQLTTVVEVDVTGISRLRDRVKSTFEQREGVKLSFLPFFAKAAVDALKTYPKVNASIDTEAGTVTYHDSENLSVAVDTERGLMVPVVHEAGDLSIAGLARKIADVAARTRDNKITPDELAGGTFTITNTGSRGALFDTPILNQPQVGMLGTGTVVKRPVVITDENLGETIAIRQMAYLALTYDHRLVDGADAARFLTAVKQRLEEAKFEADLGI